MNAIISGSSGFALVIQDGSLWTMSADPEMSKLSRHPAELRLLLNNTSHLQFLDGVEPKEIATELNHAVSCDEALHLVLIILDPDLSEEIRLEACQALEEMSWEEEVISYVCNILYAHPLPERAAIQTAIAFCERSEAQVLREHLRRLMLHQPIIAAVHLAWAGIPDILFGSREDRLQFQQAAVHDGLFWDLVTDIETFKSAERFTAKTATLSTILAFLHGQQVMEQWIENLKALNGSSLLRSTPVSSPEKILTDRDSDFLKASRDIVSAASIGLASGSEENQSSLAQAWKQYHDLKDPNARTQLIQHYAYLVKITAGRVISKLPPSLERDDLVSAGIMGLIKAVDQFDTGRQVKFETYAIALIRGAILEMLREDDWVPRFIRERIKNLGRTYTQLEVKLGRPATEVMMAAELGIETEEFQKLLAETGRTFLLSLEDILVGNGSGKKLHLSDVIHDALVPPSLEAELHERKRMLGRAIDRLPERERYMIGLYYDQGHTFKEIGKVLAISESRVYQLHAQAVLRLRGYLLHDGLSEIISVPHAPMAHLPTSARVEMTLDKQNLNLSPGVPAQIRVMLKNVGGLIDHWAITVDGFPAHWVELPTQVMRLNPDEWQVETIRVKVPKSPESHAGKYSVNVVARSLEEQHLPVKQAVQWTVQAYEDSRNTRKEASQVMGKDSRSNEERIRFWHLPLLPQGGHQVVLLNFAASFSGCLVAVVINCLNRMHEIARLDVREVTLLILTDCMISLVVTLLTLESEATEPHRASEKKQYLHLSNIFLTSMLLSLLINFKPR